MLQEKKDCIRLSCFLINGWQPELQGSRVQHSALLLIQKGCLVGVGLRQDAAFDFLARDPLPSQMFHCATMLNYDNYVVFYMCLKGLRTQRKGLAQGAALPLRVF